MIRYVRNYYFQTQGTESFARVRCFEIRKVIYHIFIKGIYMIACNAEFLKSIPMVSNSKDQDASFKKKNENPR